MNDTKKCPYCGEEIKSVAKKCRHCGSWLNETTTASVKPNSSSSDNKKYLIIGGTVVVIIAIVVAIFMMSQSTTDKRSSYTDDESVELIEEVTEELPSNSLWGMSCKDACYRGVEWRVKFENGAHAITMELEVSKKGENNFLPTNCYLDTYGDYNGITKNCASFLISRFPPSDYWEVDYSPTFTLTPDDFNGNAKIGPQSY